MKYLLSLILSGCALSPAERWYQATGLTSSANIIEKNIVICEGIKKEGCYYKSTNTIEINSNADDGTVLHELGHQFTLYHLTTGQSGVLVNKRNNMSWKPCITQDDLDLVCADVDCVWQKPECK